MKFEPVQGHEVVVRLVGSYGDGGAAARVQGRCEVYALRGPRRTSVGLYDAHWGVVHINRQIVDAAAVLARANLDLVYLGAEGG